jgi:hypothetical protein
MLIGYGYGYPRSMQFAGGGFVGVLDTYPNAAAAFSLRKLRAAYTGNAIQIRRSNDNATLDVGFDSLGNLNTSAITTFVGANSAFITIWYDQSGNGNNATQSTAANQPNIVDSGTLRVFGTKNGILFDGSDDQLNVPNLDTTALESVYLANTPSSDVAGLLSRVVSEYIAISSTNARYRTATLNTLQPLTSNAGAAINSFNRSSNVITAYRNSVASATTLTGAAHTGVQIIGRRSGSSAFAGTLAEFFYYASDQSANRAGIESNLIAYYGL